MKKPFTLNMLEKPQWGGGIDTQIFETELSAINAASKMVNSDRAAWVTVTDERTGNDLFDRKGKLAK
jgi:hypothetical protein